MRETNVTLDADEMERRAQAWHALAAMQVEAKRNHGPLFSRARSPSGVVRHEGGIQVSGHVPVDCLKLYDVMD